MGRCKADKGREAPQRATDTPRGVTILRSSRVPSAIPWRCPSPAWLDRRHCQPRTKTLPLPKITQVVRSFLPALSPRFPGRMLSFSCPLLLFPCGEGGWVGGGGGGHYSLPVCYRHEQSAEGVGPVRAVGAPLGGTVFKKFAACLGQRFLVCFCDVTTTSSASTSSCCLLGRKVLWANRFFSTPRKEMLMNKKLNYAKFRVLSVRLACYAHRACLPLASGNISRY